MLNGLDISRRINGLSLFSGIGGIDIALKDWVRPIAYCEIDPYCQGVLLSRMADGFLESAPIWDDIRTLEARCLPREIDIIYGGFPCQDISIAGAGRGLAGERSSLCYEIFRLVDEIKPRWIFLENVPAITTRGGLEVVKEITKMGYDTRWITITASSLGALHKRERWFLLAHSNHNGSSSSERRGSIRECTSSRKGSKEQEESIRETERTSFLSPDAANTSRKRLEGQRNGAVSKSEEESESSRNSYDGDTNSIASKQTNTHTKSEQTELNSRRGLARQYWPFESREHWQETVSAVCRTSDGVQFQLDRIKALGNAVVPCQAREAFKILSGLQ